MQNVYTHEEIKAFVETHLKKIGTETMHDPRINSAFIGMISQLPPAWQVLCIEPHHHSVVADSEDITRLYRSVAKNHDRVYGFYFATPLKLDNFLLNSPSGFQREARGDIGVVTVRHEKGHDFDALLGAAHPKRGQVSAFYSTLSPEWQQAVQNEASRQLQNAPFDEKDPDDILTWPKDRLSKMAAAHIKTDTLYDDYRPLMEHLGLYESRRERHNESFAEMCTHYATLYAQTGGDEAAIDLRLTQNYPELWSHFRDEVIPKMEGLAAQFLNERSTNIGLYLVAAQDLADEINEPFDVGAAMRTAKIALAKGRIGDAFEDVARLRDFFKDPIASYAAAVMELEDLYYDHGRPSFTQVSERKEQQKAYEIIQNEGFLALGDAYLAYDCEKRNFLNFLAQYERCAKALSPIMNADDYFASYQDNKGAADVFRSIYRTGGEDAVLNHLEYLPSVKTIQKFRYVYTDKIRTCEFILGLEEEDRQDKTDIAYEAVRELRTMIESGRYNDVGHRTESIQKTTDLIKSYHARVTNFIESVSIKTCGKAVMPAGTQIIGQLNHIKEQDGLSGISRKIKQLKIADDVLQSYVNIRIHHWDWAKQVSELGHRTPIINVSGMVFLENPTQKFPDALYARVADDLVKAGLKGGEKEIKRQADQYAQHIRTLKNEVRSIAASSLAGESFAAAVGQKDGRLVFRSFKDFRDVMRYEH